MWAGMVGIGRFGMLLGLLCWRFWTNWFPGWFGFGIWLGLIGPWTTRIPIGGIFPSPPIKELTAFPMLWFICWFICPWSGGFPIIPKIFPKLRGIGIGIGGIGGLCMFYCCGWLFCELIVGGFSTGALAIRCTVKPDSLTTLHVSYHIHWEAFGRLAACRRRQSAAFRQVLWSFRRQVFWNRWLRSVS